MQALARHAGLPVDTSEPVALPDDLPIERLSGWIENAAERSGVQVDQAFVTLEEIDVLLSAGGPVLIRLAAIAGAPFLAVVGRRGRFVRTLGSDLRVHRLDVKAVAATIRRPFETSVEADIDLIVERLQLTGRARARARERHDRRPAQDRAIPRLLAAASSSRRIHPRYVSRKPIGSSTGHARWLVRRPVRAVRAVVVAARPRRPDRHGRPRRSARMALVAGVARSRAAGRYMESGRRGGGGRRLAAATFAARSVAHRSPGTPAEGRRPTFRPGDRSSRDRCAGTHRRHRGDFCADRVGDRVSRVVGGSNFSGRAAASRLGRHRRLSRLAIFHAPGELDDRPVRE